MVSPIRWLSILSVNSLMFFNVSFPVLILPSIVNGGEIIAQKDESAEAERLFNQGLKLYQEGTAESIKGAIAKWEEALLLFRKTSNLSREAMTLVWIGAVYDELGEKQKALSLFNQALSLYQQVGDQDGLATTLNNIGAVYDELGEKQKALSLFNQALSLYQQVGDRDGLATTLYNISSLKYDQDKLTESLIFIEKSLEIIEDLRTKIASPELRTSYFATVQDRYKFYIELLMQLHKQNPNQGYDSKAFHASERSRARTLFELLNEANVNISQGIDPQLAAAEKKLQQQLTTIEKQRLQLYNNQPSPQQQAKFERQRDNLNQRLDKLLEKYQNLRTKILTNSHRYAQLTQPQPLTLKAVQSSVLDDNTILLQYSLGEKRSYLWAVTKTNISSYQLPSKKEIETATKKLRISITNRSQQIRTIDKAADTLTEIILAPVANQLGDKRLLIVSDGLLQYLPFATLSLPNTTAETDGYQPLLTKHQIIHSPSVSTIANIRTETNKRKVAPKTLAVIADPVFQPDDPRVKEKQTATATSSETLENVLPLQAQQINRGARDANVAWQRLPATRQEAEAIMKLVSDKQRTHVFDFEANREMALSQELGQYQFVHFATHGFINGNNPERSGLVMSLVDKNGNWKDGFLRLNDIYNLNLPVEMVVLSACQTARGKNIRGEGLVSLTTGFIYAGAARVVASLWNVDDMATAELMSGFYQGMLEQGISPVEALRKAQLEIMEQEGWQHPYYWGAFTLQGEWQ